MTVMPGRKAMAASVACHDASGLPENVRLTKKLIIKKAVAGVIFGASSLFKISPAAGSFRALMYHSVTDCLDETDSYQMTVPRQLFDRQMRYLRDNGYNVISCRDALLYLSEGRVLPPASICITFDDGFRDNMTNALPVLERYGFKATVFLTADYMGAEGYLSWAEAASIAKSGIFSIGGHGRSHRRLSGLATEDLKKEIAGSRDIFESRLGMPIHLFAYPFGCYGAFDRTVKDLIKESGFEAAFTSISGVNMPSADLFELRRTRISWYDDMGEFRKELSGAYDWYSIWQRISGSAQGA